MIFVKVGLIVLLIIGATIVFLAKKIEKKYNLRAKETIKDGDEFDKKDLEDLKRQKAIIRVKLYGMVFVLPAMILILIIFK